MGEKSFCPSPFVGRGEELRRLREFLDRRTPSIGVIYGRRRIGKSLLIEKALEGRKAFLFEGLENRPKGDQIGNFLLQLARRTRRPTLPSRTRTWREAFLLLHDALRKNPGCVVLDEFQWMANYRREIVADLKMVWDQYWSRVPGVSLVLSGSIASFMTTRVVKSNALYGRTDLVLHLKGFHLPETREMLKGRGMDEVVEAQMFFGGVPKYLDLVRNLPSVRTAVEELAFTENGYFLDEYDRIFTSHFGRNPEYERIVAALASRPYGLFRKPLARRARLEGGGCLTEHLADLELAGFLSSHPSLDRDEDSREILYRIGDAYLRFYFELVRPHLLKIRSGISPGLFSRLAQTGRFHAWRGRAFEFLCMDHARAISERLGFSGIEFTAGPYFRPPTRGREGVQIDLVFLRADNVITLCEMKCSVAPVGMSVVPEVERKAGILARRFPSKTIQRVLILHGEPSRDLARKGYFYRILRAEDMA